MEWLQQQACRQQARCFLSVINTQENTSTDYSYEDWYRIVIARAYELSQSLPKKTNRIAMIGPSSGLFLVTLFALSALDKEVVLLNNRLTKEEQDKQCQLTKVDICLSDWLPDVHLEELLAEAKTWQAEANNQSVSGMTATGHSDSSLFDVKTRPAWIDWVTSLCWQHKEEAIFAIMNTSATSGQMKSVPLRWGQIQAHVKASAQVLGVEEEDNWLDVLPLFHVSGLSIVLRSLYNGTKVTLVTKYKAELVRNLLTSGIISMVSLVPTLLGPMHLDKPYGLRVILLGGEYIPPALVDACLQHYLPVYKTYGMTETFAQSTTVNILRHPDKKESVGKPLPGVSIDIVNPDANGIGLIYIQSPMLMFGYLGKEPLRGAFNTDDVGYMDADGYLYILNRRKDLIISGGENIYPKEIEDIVYTLPKIEACALVACPSHKWGQVPILFYEGQAKADRIQVKLKEQLAAYKQPKKIIHLAHMPRNASGKILRKDLWEQAKNYADTID